MGEGMPSPEQFKRALLPLTTEVFRERVEIWGAPGEETVFTVHELKKYIAQGHLPTGDSG